MAKNVEFMRVCAVFFIVCEVGKSEQKFVKVVSQMCHKTALFDGVVTKVSQKSEVHCRLKFLQIFLLGIDVAVKF